ncbi:hypothetical protein B0H16DRAFT_1730500 [Mycena metata]|uniref:Uncharacterized protein n=1 Tax=Mycena metata TaxID=1033252 RepID=A0AAD7I9A6_9AGAR|nr:hypothetical protein B0H16DRAFT_1730500 [Mycena metata]
MYRVVAIPELIDLTIDQLANSTPDLNACALVCKFWMTRAQYHLFSTISMSYALEGNADADSRAVKRLEEMFMHSPHLASLVKNLEVTLEPGVLSTVTQIPLSAVQQVTVHCTLQQRRQRADRKSVADVQRLLRSPTVTTVNLKGRFPSIPVLNAYFRGCFLCPTVSKSGFETLTAHSIFSRLSFLVITAFSWPTFRRSLAPNLPHLQCLKLFLCAGDVDLSDLPSLCSLQVWIEDVEPEPGLSALLTALAEVSTTNRITTLHVRLNALALKDEDALRRFDARLMTLSKTMLPALRRIEFDVPLLQSGVPPLVVPNVNVNVSSSQFKSWLPLVDAKQ